MGVSDTWVLFLSITFFKNYHLLVHVLVQTQEQPQNTQVPSCTYNTHRYTHTWSETRGCACTTGAHEHSQVHQLSSATHWANSLLAPVSPTLTGCISGLLPEGQGLPNLLEEVGWERHQVSVPHWEGMASCSSTHPPFGRPVQEGVGRWRAGVGSSGLVRADWVCIFPALCV